jgi:hypothetical protein
MTDRALQEIHKSQKTDAAAAEALLRKFLDEELELPFSVESVHLRPSPVSLNSINGILCTNTGKKFFKTHIEPSSIVAEYYNAKLLEDAGYPVIAPIFASTDYGKQFLIYNYFEAPSLFESIRNEEIGAQNDGANLLKAVQASDNLLFTLYARSLTVTERERHAKQPIHQLFLHRLEGDRCRDFYSGEFTLPDHQLYFSDLAKKKWVINGIAYRDTLEVLIAEAKETLHFSGAQQISVVAGHGDAHAGNLFYFGPDTPMVYFDPAFAGEHSPLLDIIKPLVHNSLLKWLYFPDEVAADNVISYRMENDTITVDYDFRPSELRMALFKSKLDRVVEPLLNLLKKQKNLPENWSAIMQAAAMCCPFLTMNLADRQRFPPEIALLGLAMTVELGGLGRDRQHPGWLERKLNDVGPQ